MKAKVSLFIVLCGVFNQVLFAGSSLVLSQVTPNVFAIVGPLTNRSAENFGNNATFGFVITGEGVVLVDSGGSYHGAEEIHRLIRTVTDKPVIRVINSGGQDHRWFGNDYFKKLGAEIIASEAAVRDHNKRFQSQYNRMSGLIGDQSIEGTEPLTASVQFKSQLKIKIGGVNFEIYHVAPAHTPGDSFIWLPQHKAVFTGDIVYVNRMLGIGSQSNSKSWLTAFEAIEELKPDYLIPGHGGVTTLAKAKADSYDYLVFLRETISKFIEQEGDMSDIGILDLSEYNYLLNSDTLSIRNAQKVYSELEWE